MWELYALAWEMTTKHRGACFGRHVCTSLIHSQKNLVAAKMYWWRPGTRLPLPALGRHVQNGSARWRPDNPTLRKKGSKRVFQLSPLDDHFWFQVEPFWVPCRTICGKGSRWNPKALHLEPKGFFKGICYGDSQRTLSVLDSTFFSVQYSIQIHKHNINTHADMHPKHSNDAKMSNQQESIGLIVDL